MMHTSHSEQETQQLAHDTIISFVNSFQGKPIVIALEGDLGAGKTTFVQGIAQALEIEKKIKSPTFVLMKEYDIPHNPLYTELYHLDCYRLNNTDDLVPLGMGEVVKKPNTIVLVEWAERVPELFPSEHIRIQFNHKSEHERNIQILSNP